MDCILCSSSASALIRSGVRMAQDMQVRRCLNCGLIFLWPSASEKELEEYYDKSYGDDCGDPPVPERYRVGLKDAAVRIDRLRGLLGPEKEALEIGSDAGSFLSMAKPRLKRIIGVEPNTGCRRWVEGNLGMTVFPRVDDVIAEGGVYDMIFMFHVLEHMTNPVAFLRRIRALLRPQGRVIVEIPSINDALVSVYRLPSFAHFYYQKAHLFYFSKDTLKRAFNSAGLDVEIWGLQHYGLSNHLNWFFTARPRANGRCRSIIPAFLQNIYARMLIRAGCSDTLWAIGSLNGQ
jgi:SAM-dependent methyltransferase